MVVLGVLDAFLAHGSLALFFVALFATGFGFPVPEDVVLLSAGALAHRGIVPLLPAVIVCMAGVLAGDVALFTTAKRLGPAALDRPFFRRVLPPARREKLDALALCISAPAVLALGWWSSAHVDLARRGLAHAEHWLLFGVATVVLVYAGSVWVRSMGRKRRDEEAN